MRLLDVFQDIVWDPVNGSLGASPTATGSEHVALEQAWHHSTLELLAGLQVTDFSDTITGDDFGALFTR